MTKLLVEMTPEEKTLLYAIDGLMVDSTLNTVLSVIGLASEDGVCAFNDLVRKGYAILTDDNFVETTIYGSQAVCLLDDPDAHRRVHMSHQPVPHRPGFTDYYRLIPA